MVDVSEAALDTPTREGRKVVNGITFCYNPVGGGNATHVDASRHKTPTKKKKNQQNKKKTRKKQQ